jgi:hypothetical protein
VIFCSYYVSDSFRLNVLLLYSTAQDVLSAVQQTLTQHNINSVTAVGHSLGKKKKLLFYVSVSQRRDTLGAAVSLLDSVFLPLHIPGLHVAYIGYGLPRVCPSAISQLIVHHTVVIFCSQVGNQNFANYVDGNLGSFTRITNMKDPVPIVPGRFLGYHHPSNEVHISENGNWDVCPGKHIRHPFCKRRLNVLAQDKIIQALNAVSAMYRASLLEA